MDSHDHHQISGGSPSSTSSTPTLHHHQNGVATTTTTTDPMHSWWESISKARTRIHLLSSLLHPTTTTPTPTSSDFLSSIADSDRPATSLLNSATAYTSIAASLTTPSSGSGDDPLCNWLYDTFNSSDPDLKLVVLSFIPLIISLYLSRIHSLSSVSGVYLSGFEAVLLAVYSSEVKARGGKALVVNVPDLSQPSIYHTPNKSNANSVVNGKFNGKLHSNSVGNGELSSYGVGDGELKGDVGVLCPPLEPQIAVKSTKRGSIVGVVLDCYYKQISQMPSWSKLEFCGFATGCAGEECNCCSEFDEVSDFRADSDRGFSGELRGDEIVSVMEGMRDLEVEEGLEDARSKRVRIPLPWELLQPILRILGHCLLGPLNYEDVKNAASVAVRRMYARASHELNPQAILATRSLIRLDKRSREAAQAAAVVSASSNANTPSKGKKPEILLVSK
ncbi:hypothetical protein Leryth_007139 [Lithospermum erythrorhizon]|nr:hypothetical protein Leryth_007139 [Lithospermum erythrorhizon]